jgi:hypothetical protein
VLSFFFAVSCYRFLAPDAMLAAPNLPKLSRNWPLVAIAGAAGFALGIALFVRAERPGSSPC